jgi:hypothetical protein
VATAAWSAAARQAHPKVMHLSAWAASARRVRGHLFVDVDATGGQLYGRSCVMGLLRNLDTARDMQM